MSVRVFPKRFQQGRKAQLVCGLYHFMDRGPILGQKEKERAS